jgi:hypothetical protein
MSWVKSVNNLGVYEHNSNPNTWVLMGFVKQFMKHLLLLEMKLPMPSIARWSLVLVVSHRIFFEVLDFAFVREEINVVDQEKWLKETQLNSLGHLELRQRRRRSFLEGDELRKANPYVQWGLSTPHASPLDPSLLISPLWFGYFWVLAFNFLAWSI